MSSEYRDGIREALVDGGGLFEAGGFEELAIDKGDGFVGLLRAVDHAE